MSQYIRNHILLSENRNLHYFLWIDIGKDGSFYMGAQNPEEPFKVASKDKINSTVLYGDFDQFKNIASPKISFHPKKEPYLTGRIQIRSDTNYPKPKPEIIANWDIFENFNRAKEIGQIVTTDPVLLPIYKNASISNKDIVIPIDEFINKKFAGSAIAIPKGQSIEDYNYIYKNFLAAAILTSVHFDIAIVLYEVSSTAQSPWPPFFFFLIPTKEVKFKLPSD